MEQRRAPSCTSRLARVHHPPTRQRHPLKPRYGVTSLLHLTSVLAEWRGRRYHVIDVIGRWRIEGRWWEDGRDREYWRVEARGGAVWDLYHDRQRDRWHVERLWD